MTNGLQGSGVNECTAPKGRRGRKEKKALLPLHTKSSFPFSSPPNLKQKEKETTNRFELGSDIMHLATTGIVRIHKHFGSQ